MRLMLVGLAVAISACAAASESTDTNGAALQNHDASCGDDDVAESSLDRHCDEHGAFANLSTADHLHPRGAFFDSLGTNGRSCSTCHVPEDGFTIRTSTIAALFDATGGRAPIFRPVDGANSPNADLSTVEARRAAYSLLLARGTIRVSIAVPDNAEFTVDAIVDPYGTATPTKLSLYRRPLMSSNLKFAPTGFFMWDGREASLASQATNATLGHAEAASVDPAKIQEIVAFESTLFTAQTNTTGVGSLISAGGGPGALSEMPFAPNTNAPQAPPNPPVSRSAFTIFSDFATASSDAKKAVVRGRDIFNNRVFGNGPPPLRAPMTCSLCHSAINVGNNDHGGADGAAIQATGTSGEGPLAFPNSAQFLSPDLPTYTLKNKTTGATLRSNDPARALITGKWNDVGRFRTPTLRALAARAPYFHNGMAKTLLDVVSFYDKGKAIPSALPFTDQEKADLVAFLATL